MFSSKLLVSRFRQRLYRRISVTPVNSNRSVTLAEIGKLDNLSDETHKHGQLVLHKVFGYRGVIMVPYKVIVYDKDTYNAKPEPINSKEVKSEENPEIQTKTQTYYLILMDARDIPATRIINQRISVLAKTKNTSRLFTFQGTDHSSHKDLIPYTTTGDKIESVFVDLFFKYSPDSRPQYEPTDKLVLLERKILDRLKGTLVHVETTNSIRVTVIPFFLRSQKGNKVPSYWWRYSIRIENLSDIPVRVRKSHLRIFALNGDLQSVKRRGFGGYRAKLTVDSPSIQYMSQVSLPSPQGHMWGTLLIEQADGTQFECKIPTFTLRAKPEYFADDT